MKLQQQYEELNKLRQQIDERLYDLNFDKLKEMILWLMSNKLFLKLSEKDTQLSLLYLFCTIWLEEKKQLDAMGIESDIFDGVDSLKALEQKYWMIMCGIVRFETIMPEEFYDQAINSMIDYKISGMAIYKIIMRDTEEKENNILEIARRLEERGQIVTAIMLLQSATEEFAQNGELLIELANCWLLGQQWQQAYDCLKKIKKPDNSVCETIAELEKVI